MHGECVLSRFLEASCSAASPRPGACALPRVASARSRSGSWRAAAGGGTHLVACGLGLQSFRPLPEASGPHRLLRSRLAASQRTSEAVTGAVLAERGGGVAGPGGAAAKPTQSRKRPPPTPPGEGLEVHTLVTPPGAGGEAGRRRGRARLRRRTRAGAGPGPSLARPCRAGSLLSPYPPDARGLRLRLLRSAGAGWMRPPRGY